MTALAPRDERDPFCTCPNCGGLGSHAVEVIVHRTRTLPGAHGDVEIPSFAEPPDGTRRARRICAFCGHVWHTHAEQDEESA